MVNKEGNSETIKTAAYMRIYASVAEVLTMSSGAGFSSSSRLEKLFRKMARKCSS
jgi:hypothetical protein